MKLSIIVESSFHQQLLGRLLADLPQADSFRIGAGDGRDGARPVARKRILVDGEIIVFVMDAATSDEHRVLEQQNDYEYYFSWGGRGLPFKVVQFVPEIEVVFFEAPGPLERMLGGSLASEIKIAGRFAPRELLKTMFPKLGVKDRMELVERLNDDDLKQFRSHKTVADLREFIVQECSLSMAA
jgi:hypothetical protein